MEREWGRGVDDRVMKQAVAKIDGLPPFGVVAEVVDGRLLRSSFHPKIHQWRGKARCCVTCVTRADQLSDSELRAALQFVEAAAPREAVVFLDLKNAKELKAKDIKPLRTVLLGAAKEAAASRLLLCGLPNAGKSSLVLPLTRHLTLQHKKKGAYHFPKVSSQAGMTRAFKAHRMAEKPDVWLVDTPGLVPRRANLQLQLTLAASGALPSLQNLDRKQIAQTCLDALNRYQADSGLPTQYPALLNLPAPTEDIELLIKGFGKPYNEFVDRFRKGDFGPRRFEPPLPLDPHASTMRINRKEVVVGMNDRARGLLAESGG